MHDVSVTLLTLGGILLLGLCTEALSRRIHLPRVTLLILMGCIVGPSFLDILPPLSSTWFNLISTMALVMIGFLIGGTLTKDHLIAHGKTVFWYSLAVTMGTAILIILGMELLGLPFSMALLLAGISTATDPAATVDVIRETRADGTFTKRLYGIVAIDDAWGLIVFSLFLILAQLYRGSESILAIVLEGGWEIGGALLLGLVLGIPVALLTGRIRPGEPTLLEVMGIVFLCGGLALKLHVSFILAAMTMGAVVANVAKHHKRPFHAIELIEWPFLVLFFILSGAYTDLMSIFTLSSLAIAYITLRIVGRFVGGYIGGILARDTSAAKYWVGMALLPQAGIALGMALIAGQKFPAIQQELLAVVIGSTVFFELFGPICTRLALVRMGENKMKNPGKKNARE